MTKPVSACILIIGNEVLSGRTQDSNLSFLATELNKLGIQVREARVIPDIEDVIVETLNWARDTFDYVFTTGGIGPTHDDITSAAVAKAFDEDLILNEDAVAMLRTHYQEDELNEARLKMAQTPKGASLVENPISKAPGYQIGNVFVLAGVPRIAQAMFDNLKHRLIGGPCVQSKTISTDLGEGVIARALGEVQNKYNDVEIGSYPYFKNGQLGVSLVVRATDEERINNCINDLKEMIASLHGHTIFSV